MNDRFKFRVWDKSAEQYIPRSQCILLSDGTLIQEIGGESVICDDAIVEQCTGLKDKNGNLIYEGDILYYGYVSWCDEEKSFEIFTSTDECLSCSGDILWCENIDNPKIEIIGNIHENKEER